MDTIIKSLVQNRKPNPPLFIPTAVIQGHIWSELNPNRTDWGEDIGWMNCISHLIEISEGIILAYWKNDEDIKAYGRYAIYKGTLTLK